MPRVGDSMKYDLALCKVCARVKTSARMNINWRAVPICLSCAKTIFLQEAVWMAERPAPENCREQIIAQPICGKPPKKRG